MTTRTRTLTALTATTAGVLLTGLVPAAAFELPGGARDVREFACPPAEVADQGYSDVPVGDVFRLPVNCLGQLGVSRGATTGGPGEDPTYAPAASVPRFQMAVFLTRVLEGVAGAELPRPPASPTYSDTGAVTDEGQRAIEALTRVGVVQGTSATTFEPFRDVTREQMATFVARSQAYLDSVGRYSDFDAAPNPYTDGVSTVHAANVGAVDGAGIVQGRGAGVFDPRGDITRGQMAAFLTRWVDVLDEEDPATVALARNNEVFSGRIGAVPPGGSRPAVVDQDGDDNPLDDTVYTAGGLDPEREYRITLVTPESYTRTDANPVDTSGDSDLVQFVGDRTASLAAPGTTSARIIEVNGEETDAAQSLTAFPTDAGVLELRVDAEDATSVAPFLYPNSSYDYLSFSPRLELAADGRPVETFGVGPVAEYTAPVG